jgi:hypothetical protein
VTGPKLYNLAQDIHEDKDLSAINPEKVKELQASWNDWNQLNIAPLWGKASDAEMGKTSAKKKVQPKTAEPQ